MKRLPTILLLTLLPFVAHAHTGEVILQETADGLRLTVMAAPVPLRAGPADFHILAQDAATGEPVLDAVASLELTRDEAATPAEADVWQGGSCCPVTVDGVPSSVPALATRDDSRNRLFYTAPVTIPAAGEWTVTVVVTRGESRAMASTSLAVARPLSAAENYWYWWAVPPLAVGVFAAHQRLQSRRRHV